MNTYPSPSKANGKSVDGAASGLMPLSPVVPSLLKKDGLSQNGFPREQDIRSSNALLNALPSELWHNWSSHCRRVLIHQDQVLLEHNSTPDHVYFIEKGLVSLVTCLQRLQVEAAVIGPEGVVGASPFKNHRSFCRAVVRVPGKALRLPIKLLQEECRANLALQNILWSHQQLISAQHAQSALCSGTHTLMERLCRWLLTIRERTGNDELEITHLCIANVLGTRRAGVTVALGQLKRANLLEVTRNCIVINDPAGIASHACQCYDVVCNQFHEFDRSLHAGSN
jgi:CRP-like cAMP-binding protein